MSLVQINKVREYYDSAASDYKEFWRGERAMAMHFGYHDHRVETHEQSLLRMNEEVARLARVTGQDRVLDAGCGYGGSSIWLALNKGCRVEGVNVVSAQLKGARRFAAKYNVLRKVRFSRQDYCATGFRSNSFDVVWALESVVHTDDKVGFATESARLLKSGGRLVMSDLVMAPKIPCPRRQKKRLSIVESGWAITNLLTPYQCRKLFVSAGFTDVRIRDWTKKVRQSVKRLADLCRAALPGANAKLAANLWNRARFENVLACIYIDKLLDAGVFRYMVMTARKL